MRSQTEYPKRTILRQSLNSYFLSEERELLIYLPQNLTTHRKYPLLILQDGKDYLMMGRIATQANQLIHEQQIKPLIIVAIPVARKNRTAEYSPLGDKHLAYRHFIIHELLPYLKKQYPVDSHQIVIGGSSLGATVALHIALAYPNLIHQVLSQSGAFLTKTAKEIKQQSTLASLRVYLSVGLSETAVPTHKGTMDLLKRNREIYQLLKTKQAQICYVEKAGDHTWGLWQNDLPDALRYFFR